MILGGQSLIVDQVILASNRRIPAIVAGQSATDNSGYRNGSVFSNNGYQGAGSSPYQNVGYRAPIQNQNPNRLIRTKEWMPWSLLATGAIIVMYTLSLPPATNKSSWGGSDE